MRSALPLLPTLALGFLVPLPMAGQSALVDEGVFQITVDGQPAGTESFSIRRSGTGADAQIIATAEIQMTVPEGRLDLRPALQVSGEDMAVAAYQVKVSGHRQEEVYVTLGDRRFLTRIRSEQGLQEREFRATPETVLLDARAAHQYYFVNQRAGAQGGSFPVIVPSENRQYTLRISIVGEESIQIGGQSISARHLRLEGNDAPRDLWVDSEGRVLRLVIESEGFVATRESRP